MSDMPEQRPGAAPVTVLPVQYAPPPRSCLGTFFRFCLNMVLVGSIFLNLVLLSQLGGCGSPNLPLDERYHSGKKLATNKIAIVNVDGVLMEGMTGYARKQIDRAADDNSVKGVVLRINSPGGSITASDDLHRRLLELRDGSTEKNNLPKPLVVSMASMAASGGYYIAMPAKTLFAEKTSITGSIGVYAAFPNVTELGEKVGFKMDVIKAGKVKDSGSPFHEMTAEERLLWESMVDRAYLQFLDVVEVGRPKLKGELQKDLVIDEKLPVRNQDGMEKIIKMTRYRADGGIYTAQEALKYGLIDKIGYLDDAIAAAREAAGVGDDFRAISYERPATLMGILTGEGGGDVRADPSRWAASALPRLWYLAPGAELAGLIQAAGK